MSEHDSQTTAESSIRLLARETYRKTRFAHPHMPHEDTAAGQMKLDRLFDILWKHVGQGSAKTHG